jgi:hypothetical protein
MIHAALGETHAAFELIDRAIERRFTLIYLLRNLPLDSLYAHPHYKSCLRRIGLPPHPRVADRCR